MSDSRFSLPIECGKCGRIGKSIWDKGSALVGVAGGFYERVQRLNHGLTEVVCSGCETVQPNLVRAC